MSIWGSKSVQVFSGVQDAMTQWWYGHNAVGFFLTAGFLGMMYYFVPKQAGRPVYSYKLSIIHFWALIFLYIWAAPMPPAPCFSRARYSALRCSRVSILTGRCWPSAFTASQSSNGITAPTMVAVTAWVLILYCLTQSHWLPEGPLVQTAFAYLGVQVILSYFISGWVKILNPAWRSGAALRDVLAFLPIPWQKTCAPLPPIPAPCGPHRGPSSGSRFCSPSPCSTRRC